MQWWYYRGAVTTPVDIPGKGPTVVRPRDRFQAPFSAVANLKRLRLVVPCKPPKGESPPPKKTEPAKAPQERAVTAATVVALPAEPQAKVTEVAPPPEEKPKKEAKPKESEEPELLLEKEPLEKEPLEELSKSSKSSSRSKRKS